MFRNVVFHSIEITGVPFLPVNCGAGDLEVTKVDRMGESVKVTSTTNSLAKYLRQVDD